MAVKLFSQIMIMFAKLAAFSLSRLEVVSLDAAIPCKKTMARRGSGNVNQQITVLVYGSSPPKSHEQGYLNF